MTNFQIFLLVYGIISVITFVMYLYFEIKEHKKEAKKWTISDYLWLLVILIFGPTAYVIIPLIKVYDGYKYLKKIKKAGGWKAYLHKREVEQKEEEEVKQMSKAYKSGAIKRSELPRTLDGIYKFELKDEKWISDGPYLLYVETEYNKALNDFFMHHDIDLSNQKVTEVYKPEGVILRWVYLPKILELMESQDTLNYLMPSQAHHLSSFDGKTITVEFLSKLLVYPKDISKISQGLFLVAPQYMIGKYGQRVRFASYYPIKEGDEAFIQAQIKSIAVEYYCHILGGVPKIAEYEEDDTNADATYDDMLQDPVVQNLLDEVKERIDQLRKCGLTSSLVMSILEKEQPLSKLVITKDYRILLPDYHDMEIKMEPLVKAVFLLFLKHPEGIMFKELPDYRKELVKIYVNLKPNGMNDRVRKSIEDVTNPMLNSINEKCARIRGAFVSQFDDSIAKNYYITGLRAEPKLITLSRDLVEWEK